MLSDVVIIMNLKHFMIILPNKIHPLHLLASLCLSSVFSNLTRMYLKGLIIASYSFAKIDSFEYIV